MRWHAHQANPIATWYSYFAVAILLDLPVLVVMSRIIIKNLPKNITDSHLKEQFSKCGQITDVKLMKTRSGMFRHFAFVGYSSESQGTAAVEHFNKTYIKANRIEVEVAKPYGDDELNRPWSKYSKGSSAHNKHERETRLNTLNSEKPSNNVKNEQKRIEDDIPNDPEFKEFMDVHTTTVWGDAVARQQVR